MFLHRKLILLLIVGLIINSSLFTSVFANQQNFFGSNVLAANQADDIEEDWDDEDWGDEDWDDEDWDDEDWDDEDWGDKKSDWVKESTPTVPAKASPKQTSTSTSTKTKQQVEKQEPVTAKPELSSAEEEPAPKPEVLEEEVFNVDDYLINEEIMAAEEKILAEKYFNKSKAFAQLYKLHRDQLKGLNPDDPEDLKEINKLLEIVGVAKKRKQKTPPGFLKKDDPMINFSARNITVRDAFATLARISGKSITVSGAIQDRDTISVVEINDQPFSQAFFSLVQAAGVDFAVNRDNYTILRRTGAKSAKVFSLESPEVDMNLDLLERVTDLAYDNETISNILKDLVNKYGVDIVMTATPSERITLRVRGVNVEEALKLILAGSQFEFTRSDEAFVIYSKSNKNFALDKKTVFFPLKYIEAKEISKLLPSGLKEVAKASELHNAVIAEGSKAELTQLFEFLRTIDKPVPQVELEVQLIELAEDLSRSINIIQNSITIGRFGKLVPDPSNPSSGGNGTNLVTRGFDINIGPDEIGLFLNQPTVSQNQTFNRLKVNQKLLVSSGKSAKINFDEDSNIVLGDATGSGNLVAQNQRIQRITAGNSLDITPIVGGSGIVTLKVEIEVSANQGVPNAQNVPPTTLRRRLSSEVQVANHETIAVGGLFNDRNDFGGAKIPFLGSVPILGNFFGNDAKIKEETELLVLITPHVKSGLDENETKYVQAEVD